MPVEHKRKQHSPGRSNRDKKKHHPSYMSLKFTMNLSCFKGRSTKATIIFFQPAIVKYTYVWVIVPKHAIMLQILNYLRHFVYNFTFFYCNFIFLSLQSPVIYIRKGENLSSYPETRTFVTISFTLTNNRNTKW